VEGPTFISTTAWRLFVSVFYIRTAHSPSGHTNALAEAFNSLFKAELIRNKGPWTGINDVETAVAEYIDWFNQRRLHDELGYVTPAEHEVAYYAAEPHESLQKTS
ncbi:integrase core domain-containing protein, partial [Streptomyces sp. NPDC101776]|uniref:integrase core domain-containing protein n=1 Tax=Streptomyces sp. NPDC101776 TaxID=3366146 RepID=UPI00381F2A28